jgi:L-ascorbate metabolism protein UlaG (beta-lactamase superfamily)
VRLTWIGHATVLVELDAVRLVTDPVLRSRVAHLRRAPSAPSPPAALGDVDASLVSHAHWDHLDLPSLRLLGHSRPVVCPRGAGDLLRRKRFDNVIELRPGEEVSIGGVAVRATHAEHEGSRGPFGRGAPALGYVVSGSRSIYFAGDTDLFAEMSGLVEQLDVALLPVAGWGRRLGPGHLDPVRAAEALRLLGPRIAIPIHWGTFAPLGARESGAGPADEFVRHAAELAPEVEVRVLPVGGSTSIS